MRSLIQIILFATGAFILTSCSKNKTSTSNGQNTPSELEKMIVGSWKYHGGEPCQADDYYIFRSDKRYTVDEGSIKCGSMFSGNEWDWEITKDSILNPLMGLVGNSASQSDLRIIRLDNDTMLLRGVEWGAQAIYTYTRKK